MTGLNLPFTIQNRTLPVQWRMNLQQRIESMARERREMIGRLEFREAGAWLGEPAGFPLAAEADLPRPREMLAGYGIAGALLSHWSGQTVSPREGNRELFAAREAASAGTAAPGPGFPGSTAPALLGGPRACRSCRTTRWRRPSPCRGSRPDPPTPPPHRLPTRFWPECGCSPAPTTSPWPPG